MTRTLEEARANILAARGEGDTGLGLLGTDARQFILDMRNTLGSTRSTRFGNRYGGQDRAPITVPTPGHTPVDPIAEQRAQDEQETTGKDITDRSTDPISDQLTNDRLAYMNQFIRDQYPSLPAGTSLGKVDMEKFTKWLLAKIGGSAAGALLGGGLLGAGVSQYTSRELNDFFGNYNWWGPDQGIMSPNSPAYIPPPGSAPAAPPPGGIMNPASPDFVEPGGVTEPWQGRAATDSHYIGVMGGNDRSITGGGNYNYATRLTRRGSGGGGGGGGNPIKQDLPTPSEDDD